MSALSAEQKILLHVGCGPPNPTKLHPWFRDQSWLEVRIDIDARVRPMVVGDVAHLEFIRDGSADAIWSSHMLEHLFEHDCRRALKDFVRVLKPSGYVLIHTPDLQKVAHAIVDRGLDQPLYDSPAGTVYPLDTIFGMRSSIERGNGFMAHRTGFSLERLGTMLLDAGFREARVWDGSMYDLWAVGLREAAEMKGQDQPNPNPQGRDGIG